jgi:hypothetical protein
MHATSVSGILYASSDYDDIALHCVQDGDLRQLTPLLKPELPEQGKARLIVAEYESQQRIDLEAWGVRQCPAQQI